MSLRAGKRRGGMDGVGNGVAEKSVKALEEMGRKSYAGRKREKGHGY